MVLDRVAHLGRRHPALAVQRHQRVRGPAEPAGIHAGRIAADHAVGLEPVDAPLDRRRGQRDAQADALKAAPSVLSEERNDLPVDVIHYATEYAIRRNGSGLASAMKRRIMNIMSTQPIVAPSKTEDFMPLHGIDHVEFYVGNALQAAAFWVKALGFKEIAYAGLETGVRDRASHVLEQGRIRIVLTGALVPGHEIGEHVARHGDGVKVIALGVPDVDHAYREATTRGAHGVEEPHDITDEHGTVRRAAIK